MSAVAPFAPAPIAGKDFLPTFFILYAFGLLCKGFLYSFPHQRYVIGKLITEEINLLAYSCILFHAIFFFFYVSFHTILQSEKQQHHASRIDLHRLQVVRASGALFWPLLLSCIEKQYRRNIEGGI